MIEYWLWLNIDYDLLWLSLPSFKHFKSLFSSQSPGYSTEIFSSSLEKYKYPDGHYWKTDEKEARRIVDPLGQFKKRKREDNETESC